jgi:hypothetical protein
MSVIKIKSKDNYERVKDEKMAVKVAAVKKIKALILIAAKMISGFPVIG